MAESLDVKCVSIPVDTTTTGTALIWKCPEVGGGITIIDAFVCGVGTITCAAYTMTNVGTPAANGTIIASAAATVAANIPLEKTVADGFVEAGEWIGFDVSAGTALGRTSLVFSYVHGK